MLRGNGFVGTISCGGILLAFLHCFEPFFELLDAVFCVFRALFGTAKISSGYGLRMIGRFRAGAFFKPPSLFLCLEMRRWAEDVARAGVRGERNDRFFFGRNWQERGTGELSV